MKSKTIVTVSRQWNNPHIETTVSNTEIALRMSMDDFEEALAEEIGSVTMTLTKSQFRKKLSRAVINVIAGIKEESRKSM